MVIGDRLRDLRARSFANSTTCNYTWALSASETFVRYKATGGQQTAQEMQHSHKTKPGSWHDSTRPHILLHNLRADRSSDERLR